MKQRREKLGTKHADLETGLSRIKSAKSKEMLEMGSLHMAIENLYVQVSQRLGRRAKVCRFYKCEPLIIIAFNRLIAAIQLDSSRFSKPLSKT